MGSEDFTQPTNGKKLTDTEKELFKAIDQRDVERVKTILGEGVAVDCLDDYGTTPLQQAAFKGSLEICSLLLHQGADVNSNEHEQGYTALMFASLSGNPELCQLLLEAGAHSHKTNRVGKTASELAAFTSQHRCVSVISNFLSLDDIKLVIRSDDLLPLVPSIHALTRSSNVHPVKTLLYIRDHLEFLSHQKKVLSIFEELMEKQMKGKEANEVMALKLHILNRTLRELYRWMEKEKTEAEPQKLVEKFAKNLLAMKDEAWPERLELMMRQAIKEFPFHHCVVFQTIVKTLHSTALGSEPAATSLVRQTLVGQRMIMDEVFCVVCGEPGAHKRCSVCKATHYCNSECQKLHWSAHKKWCRPPVSPS